MNNEYHTVSRTLSYWHSRWRNIQNDRNATQLRGKDKYNWKHSVLNNIK